MHYKVVGYVCNYQQLFVMKVAACQDPCEQHAQSHGVL